jgi:hypothetical protein
VVDHQAMKLRPSYANVAATLALIFALGGTAVAAGRYVITSARQVKPGALGLVDFSRAATAGLRGPRGHTGLQGAPGQQGPPGPPAATYYAYAGADGSWRSGSAAATVTRNSAGDYTVTVVGDNTECPAVATTTDNFGFANVALQGPATGGWSYELHTADTSGTQTDEAFGLVLFC